MLLVRPRSIVRTDEPYAATSHDQSPGHRASSPGLAAGAGTVILAPAAGCGGALTSDDHSTDGPAGSAVVRTSAEQERIQCLVCGLWLGSLGQHLPIHHLTGTDYKTRFALPGRARMSGYRPRRTAPPARSPQYWGPDPHRPRVSPRGSV